MWRKADKQATPGSRRDRIAMMLALLTAVAAISAFCLSKGTQVLMPGPLASVHGAIENCSSCHAKSGNGKLSFIRGLVAGDPLADSKSCLTCHKMPDTAFNAHGASKDVLKASTERLEKIAAATPQPHSARAQSTAFPTHDIVARDLTCATCHQEHQGIAFDLGKISNEQCRSCHVVKFDSFDGQHPKFENYPFERRTRIIYDHAGHFGKHYPEVAKKDPAKRIPETCSSCHTSRDDTRIMALEPFDQTCSSCHLDQIIGKERASGPKGVAFLTVPGIDLQSLKSKNAAIGEWPEASEAALTPFMKVMIGRHERGRALIKAVDSLNLQDLTTASDDQIQAVTRMVWEIKGLFYALIKGKGTEVLGDLKIGGGAKLSAAQVTDLTASIPRDVVISAQQEWLPNLAAEMADRPANSDQEQSQWSPVITEPSMAGPASRETPPGPAATAAAQKVGPDAEREDGAPGKSEAADATSDDGEETISNDGSSSGSDADAGQAAPSVSNEAKGGEEASASRLDPPVCVASVFGQCLVYKEQKAKGEAAKPDGGKGTFSAGELPGRMNAGATEVWKLAQAEEAAGKSDGGTETLVPGDSGGAAIISRQPLPSGTPRAIEAQGKAARKAAEPRGAATTTAKPGEPRATGTPGKDREKAVSPEEAAGKNDTANAKPDGGKETRVPSDQPQAGAANQSDDLLFPTEEELREIDARRKNAGSANSPDNVAGKSDAASSAESIAPAAAAAGTGTAAAKPPTRAAPVVSIASDVDPESWADHGGWYRQDYAIFYRPTGHKDKFIYSWLSLTGPQAPKGASSPAAAVFDYLTGKDAQGSCTKCHSVDDIPGKGRAVNFTPLSVGHKQGRFTNFIHEPHFGLLENRGCLACHAIEKGRQYLKSYEQGDPQNFASDFGAVKKDLCQSCHTTSMSRQDCLLCHKYHVNGVVTPIMSTKLPAQ